MSYSLRSGASLASISRSSEPRATLTSTPARKTGTPGQRALIDTSVLADLKKVELRRLPPWLAASALTIAELMRGPGDLRGLEQLIEISRRERVIRLWPVTQIFD